MENIYWLLLASTSVLSVLGTIIYFKWEDIKSLGCRKITFVFTKSKVRDQVYDVFKEMNPQYRRYIRSQVREYLKELQNEPTTKTKK
tara:strand:+ start:442 stop:702 length:261 start_codon:yes stop_codon:yes gene_type:complete